MKLRFKWRVYPKEPNANYWHMYAPALEELGFIQKLFPWPWSQGQFEKISKLIKENT